MITVYYWVGEIESSDGSGFEMISDEGSGSVEVVMRTSAQDSIIAYIDYIKGSETELTIAPSVSEKRINNGKYYNDSYLDSNHYVMDRSFSIDHSTKIRFPIVLATNENYLKLNISLAPTSGDGVAEIYLVPSSPYI